MSVSSQQTKAPLLQFKEDLLALMQKNSELNESIEETKSKFMSDVKAKIIGLNGFCEELDIKKTDLNDAKQVLTDSLHTYKYLDEFELLLVDPA